MKINMEEYTSLELSKKLAKNGCELFTRYKWIETVGGYKLSNEWLPNSTITTGNLVGRKERPAKDYYAYDILNDICCRFSKEFFGDDYIEQIVPNTTIDIGDVAYLYRSYVVLKLLQQGKKKKAEDYIWKHCLFNPKNICQN